MGYRINYEPIKKVRGAEKRISRVPALTALFLVVFLLLVNAFWPQGAETLRDFLLPGDPVVTAAALETFAQELQAGQPIGRALEGFCIRILEGAGA